MTAAEQQALFDQTRARIQSNLNRITELSNNSLDPKVFLPEFLRLAANCLNAQGGALWAAKEGGFDRIAEENFATCLFDENPEQREVLLNVLQQTQQTAKQHIIAPGNPSVTTTGESKNVTPFPYFFTPIIMREKVVAIFVIWMRDAGDENSYNEIAAFLGGWVSHAVNFLRNHQGAVSSAQNREFSLLLQMQAALLGELDPKQAASIIANYTSDLLRADLTCLFRKTGKGWKFISASNQEVIDEKSHQSRLLIALTSHLEPTAQPAISSLASEENEARKDAMEATGYTQFAWKQLVSPTHHADHLLCAFRHSEEAFAANTAGLMDRLGESAGKSLDSAHHYHAIPLRTLLSPVSRLIVQWKTHRRGRIIAVIIALAVIATILCAIPVPLKITADCIVEPHFKSIVVVEAQGKITAVAVKEGEHVQAGQVIAKMEDEDYTTQIAVAQQQKLRWQVEAGRAQSSGNEAERKLADINMQREVEAINRLNYLRERTEIKSPIAGTVVTKNLYNRVGEPLEIGSPFCEVVGDGSYDLILKIKQSDIGDLLRAIESNKTLPVDFILHSHSQEPMHSEIPGVEIISQLPEIEKDHSIYLVKVPFPRDSPLEQHLKPGYTGKAKIRIGQTNIIYSWFRPFLNYWIVEWGV